MKNEYHTSRLLLNDLTVADSDFIIELVNTAEWIRFIGNRHINNREQATAYIKKLIENPAINYRVVRLKDLRIAIGVVTFMKRDYLDHYDIGFAFLPKYTKQGYAFEATAAVLNELLNNGGHPYILATTLRENSNSVRLLEKSGFEFNSEIINEGQPLLLYRITKDKFIEATHIS